MNEKLFRYYLELKSSESGVDEGVGSRFEGEI
ncbi:hypothetical protein J2Z66_001198 [Paenibacillus eucommiae]|uniref:Uncharacterized protein n=1 Tax=Paenibacillus eucommiae TaxID=1355755 RepID=A0ABS4IPZ4_9BACL|nr:hypothetical protein [Paenibacillus eucommiae]